VGIAVILAQAGCPVPARSFKFSPFQSLFTRILNTDNLWSGLSSFAVEMTELREIVGRAGPRSLVLGDELCSGTESVSATALVGASLQYLHERGVRFIFATHLHGLAPIIKDLNGMKVWHLKVRYDSAADRLIYERTLTPGAGSSLYGLEVARAMNLPADLIDRAMAIRRGLLGTGTDVDAPLSQWNPLLQRRVCERCGVDVLGELEVHHIEEQAVADEVGRLPSGQHKDHVRNLIVVCRACHDLHHAGKITIRPMQQTSDGPLRIIDYTYTPQDEEPEQESRRSSKWNSDQIRIIEGYLKKYPMCPPKRIVLDLREKEGIQISVVALKGFRV
jgi:DNA mismatch repair protein MutS